MIPSQKVGFRVPRSRWYAQKIVQINLKCNLNGYQKDILDLYKKCFDHTNNKIISIVQLPQNFKRIV